MIEVGEVLKLIDSSLEIFEIERSACGMLRTTDIMVIENLKTIRQLLCPSERKPNCCHIGCEKKVFWHICHGKGGEENAECCQEHLSNLISDHKNHTIYRIDS